MNPPKRRARPVADSGAPLRDGNVELITMMLEALEKEHEFLCALNPAFLPSKHHPSVMKHGPVCA